MVVNIENVIIQLLNIQELLSKKQTIKEEYVNLFGNNDEKLASVNIIAKDLEKSFSENQSLGGKLDFCLFEYSFSSYKNWVNIIDLIHFLKEEVSFYDEMKRKISSPSSEKEVKIVKKEIESRLDSFRERAETELSKN
ncbi:MAG: hypothetical protein EA362_08850 [Saprospirales bacterium]|nr:MAG: hypothetical protein EA362_08850 [Saprospirales bacterium]